MRTLIIFSLAIGSFVSAEALPQELTAKNYRQWMELIRPHDDEEKWKMIAWRNKLMPAVDEAKRLQRPVLLWTMNGNPCGET